MDQRPTCAVRVSRELIKLSIFGLQLNYSVTCNRGMTANEKKFSRVARSAPNNVPTFACPHCESFPDLVNALAELIDKYIDMEYLMVQSGVVRKVHLKRLKFNVYRLAALRRQAELCILRPSKNVTVQ